MKPKKTLPPGEYTAKVVSAKAGPRSRLTMKIEVQQPGRALNREDIERLAQVAWENTGKGDLPVLPPGHGWVDAKTGEAVDLKDLVTTWEKVTTKDIFRRQAAAIAQALGFKLADDVEIRPRDLTKGGGGA